MNQPLTDGCAPAKPPRPPTATPIPNSAPHPPNKKSKTGDPHPQAFLPITGLIEIKFVVVLGLPAALGAVSATAATSPIVVTRGSAALPAGCSPGDVAAVVADFNDAFNRG